MNAVALEISPEFATESCYAMLQAFAPIVAARSTFAPSFGLDSITAIESMLADAPVRDEDGE
jgi:hypothetical protein